MTKPYTFILGYLLGAITCGIANVIYTQVI